MPPKRNVDPEFIGPHCHAIGLSRSNLGCEGAVSVQISNGVVFEVNRLAVHGKIHRTILASWFSALGVQFENEAELFTSVDTLCSRREFLRRRKKQEDISALECQQFEIEARSETITDPHLPATSPPCAVPPKRPDDLKEANTLSHTIAKKIKQVSSLEGKVSDLQEELSTKRKEIGHYGPFNVDRRDARHRQTRIDRDQGKAKILELTAINHQLTKTVELLEESLRILKVKYHKKQQAVAYYRSSRKMPGSAAGCSSCSSMKKTVNNLIMEKERVEGELEEARRDRYSVATKDDQGAFSQDVRLCVLELIALEVATGKVKDVMKVVAKYLFEFDIPDTDLPSKRTCQKIADEGHVLAKSYIGERMQESKAWGLHKDGTSRKKVKILDTAVCLDDGETLSLGFSTVASETGQAIADDSIRKLGEVQADDGDVLQKMTYTMSDRAANEKKSNILFCEWRDEQLVSSNTASASPPPKLQHFFCMAHVLLGFHTESVTRLKEVQTQLTDGGRLGRDCHPGFKAYKITEAAPRLCTSASNAFAPVGDYMGVRDIWNAYCTKNNIMSLIKNYKDNRFNGLFHTCAAIVYHRHQFLDILTKLKNPNKKLQALQKDLEDDNLMTIAHGLGIMYVKVTAPFWTLITSKLSYLQIQPSIRQLHTDLQTLQQSPLSITTQTLLPSLQNCTSHSHLTSIVPAPQDINASLELVLKTLIRAFVTLMDRQLQMYLTSTVSDENIKSTSFAPATNLVCERNFGDLDSSQHRRPSASMHHHTTVHLLKRSRKKLAMWMRSMPTDRRSALLKKARKQGPSLRKQHQSAFKEEVAKSLNKIKPCTRKRKSPRDIEQSDDSDEDEDMDAVESSIDITPGCWVAVAYPEGWYPGIVESIDDSGMLDVNFAHWCSNRKDVKWPDGKDRHPVHRHFIFHGLLKLHTNNCRSWSIVGDTEEIESSFIKFKEKYF